MARDVISEKFLKRILSEPSMLGMNFQSVRNAVSQIHKDNYGITMNAAAYAYALKKGFSIYKSLSPEDKKSLQFLKSQALPSTMTKREVGPRKRDVKPGFKSLFLREANDNASAYVYIYILENELRRMIFEKFGKSQTWWTDKTKVSEGIQQYAARIQAAEKKYPWLKTRGDDPIYYVGLHELFKIIEGNWRVFKDVFDDLELLRAWMKESVPIRNLVAHNVRTRPQERQNAKIKTDYVTTLISKWYDRQSKLKTSHT
jgi:hypothetical protein